MTTESKEILLTEIRVQLMGVKTFLENAINFIATDEEIVVSYMAMYVDKAMNAVEKASKECDALMREAILND